MGHMNKHAQVAENTVKRKRKPVVEEKTSPGGNFVSTLPFFNACKIESRKI